MISSNWRFKKRWMLQTTTSYKPLTRYHIRISTWNFRSQRERYNMKTTESGNKNNFLFFIFFMMKTNALNERRKFVLIFKIETKLRDQGTSLLCKSFFWFLKSSIAWTACGILGILGGDYSRRRSPRPPTELANLSLENTENTCKQIVSAKRDLAYRDQVELVIQPRMDKLQQVYKIYQAQGRFEIAANLSSLDNSAFKQMHKEKQLDSKWKSNEYQTT